MTRRHGMLPAEGISLYDHRACFPALDHGVYLNFAERGVMAEQTIDAITDNLVTLQSIGPSSRMATALIERELRGLRAAIGGILGVPPRRVALFSSVSHALSIAFAGIAWQSGDTVVIGADEPPGSALWAETLRDRHGVRVRRAAEGVPPEEAIPRLLDASVRLVVASHVDWIGGQSTDIARLVAEIRGSAASGAAIVIDGAQAVGARAVDLDGLDIDLYAGTGQKWLGGPDGQAFAVLQGDRLDPTQIGWRAIDGSDMATDRPAASPALVLSDDAGRFESGTLSAALACGLRTAIATADAAMAPEERFRRIAEGTAALRRLLAAPADRDGTFTLVGPETSAGIVGFRPRHMPPAVVHAALAGRRIQVRHHRYAGTLRASVHYMTTEDDIAAFADALEDVLAAGRASAR